MRENYVLCSPVFCPNTGEYGAKKLRIHGAFMYQKEKQKKNMTCKPATKDEFETYN